jgi:hypothetical protein
LSWAILEDGGDPVLAHTNDLLWSSFNCI